MQLNGTSKGNQRKWMSTDNEYVKEQFYYQNKYWRDDLVGMKLGIELRGVK